jgi:hypothetical protein
MENASRNAFPLGVKGVVGGNHSPGRTSSTKILKEKDKDAKSGKAVEPELAGGSDNDNDANDDSCRENTKESADETHDENVGEEERFLTRFHRDATVLFHELCTWTTSKTGTYSLLSPLSSLLSPLSSLHMLRNKDNDDYDNDD